MWRTIQSYGPANKRNVAIIIGIIILINNRAYVLLIKLNLINRFGKRITIALGANKNILIIDLGINLFLIGPFNILF